MDDDQQFCLRWNNHQSTLISVFDTLLENETLVDCTLAAEGKILKAHKVVLSACSPYFATLLQEQYDKHPIFILKDVKYQELRAMMDYMYRGEVNISQDQLAALLKAAESLQIKGLSDNRGGSGNNQAPKMDTHHRGLHTPNVGGGGGGVGGKLSGSYTLEQTKRARLGPSSMDSQELSGSREGSSSPSRRRRKVRRRSIENDVHHDNSNSSLLQTNQSALLHQQTNAAVVAAATGLSGVSAITAAASALAAAQLPTVGPLAIAPGSGGAATTTAVGTTSGTAANTQSGTAATTQQSTTSVTKKTECAKGTSDAMNTDNVVAPVVSGDEHQTIEQQQHTKSDKLNHKQKLLSAAKDANETVEPKHEYDDEANEETVEDLTLDDEEMGMDDLDHNAGTSQGGEGSSQGFVQWQHDRSQEELLLATQDAQQRDPQDVKNVKTRKGGRSGGGKQINRKPHTCPSCFRMYKYKKKFKTSFKF